MGRGIRDGNIGGEVPPRSGKSIGGRFRPEDNIVFANLKNIPAGNPASGVVGGIVDGFQDSVHITRVGRNLHVDTEHAPFVFPDIVCEGGSYDTDRFSRFPGALEVEGDHRGQFGCFVHSKEGMEDRILVLAEFLLAVQDFFTNRVFSAYAEKFG